ncbi:hypothetical protein [Arcticibacter eurypsychrophilus]|uniref:hypothetical protein n=1 Tax=Arcticibacter eurypsychrophilus TaxID=1434752 RepID=UPI00147C72EB|nr:hypothetical protein [Arcticibacter eurypsychrophilus]
MSNLEQFEKVERLVSLALQLKDWLIIAFTLSVQQPQLNPTLTYITNNYYYFLSFPLRNNKKMIAIKTKALIANDRFVLTGIS